MEHQTIHEAINAVMDEVGYVKKSKAANLNYSFAGEAALIAAIRPSMVEHGIYMYVSEIISINRENYTTAKGTAMVNTVIHAKVKFSNCAGDSVIVAAVGEGSDSGDKSANKAMTGLYKYALRQTFCIETGDDPDKYASEERAPNDHRAKLVDKYQKLSDKAFAAGLNNIPTLTAEMSEEEIIAQGVELKARLENK